LMEYSLMFYIIFISIYNLIIRKSFKFDYLSRAIIFLCFYLLILSLTLSSDPWLSFKSSLPIISSLTLFLSLYNSFIYPNNKYIKITYYQLVGFLLLFLVNTLILSIFGLGGQLMMGREFGVTSAAPFLRMGQFTHFDGHAIAIITPMLLASTEIYKKGLRSWFTILIIVVVTLLLLLITKRSYLITLIIGILIYFIYFFFYSKTRVKSIISVFFIVFLTIIFLRDFYEFFIQTRSDAMQTEFVMQGRNQEIILYPEVVKYHPQPTKFILLGEELFNSSGKFRILDLVISGGTGRFLHNDYAHLLYGSGIIGLFLYISILIKSVLKGNGFRKKVKGSFEFALSVCSILLAIGLLTSGYADGILSLVNRAVPFYFLGVFLCFLRSKQMIYAR